MAKLSKAALREQIRKLPANIDTVLAADVALEILVDSAWAFSRDCKRLPPAVIRELLGRKPVEAIHIYFTLAVDPDAKDGTLLANWARAIQGLADLETINRWASKQKKEKFAALAKDKHLLPAIQGAAANGENVSMDMLAVLVADGSDESIDALIPHLDAAGSTHRLDALRMLRVHAKDTPALRTLLAELDRDAEASGIPAHRIARLIGLPESNPFWFRASVSSQAPEGHIPPIQLHVEVDSRKAAWFKVYASRIARGEIEGHTSFTHDRTHDDQLGIGRCDAAELPTWLASVAKKLRIAWDTPFISSNVRGAKRDRIAHWLVPRR